MRLFIFPVALMLTVAVGSAQNMQRAITNLANGERFLAQNKTREEVKVTKSGLQYEVVREGAGAAPKPTNRVTVHYEGKLIDGTVFDSSYSRGQPATFGVTQVIRGWTEGLQLMKPGAVICFTFRRGWLTA
jgi:FKBP-type peptidyl-prolyl cis-trans isomerase FklB